MLWKEGNTNTGRNLQLLTGQQKWRRQRQTDFFCYFCRRILLMQVLQQDNKFVTAKPGDRISLPNRVHNTLRSLLQQQITDRMTKVVIDLFKTV